MGTFHQGRGELHGVTVVVETTGSEVWVGRCDSSDERGVLLLDADVYLDGADAGSRQEFLGRAAAVGVWAKHREVVIPRQRVASIRRLGEL